MDDVFIKVTREDFEKRYISRAAYDAEVTALRARVAELEDLNSDPVCEWKRESDWDSDTWEAGCGMSWVFEDGDPSENEMNYCPSCGRRLVIIITPPEAE